VAVITLVNNRIVRSKRVYVKLFKVEVRQS